MYGAYGGRASLFLERVRRLWVRMLGFAVGVGRPSVVRASLVALQVVLMAPEFLQWGRQGEGIESCRGLLPGLWHGTWWIEA